MSDLNASDRRPRWLYVYAAILAALVAVNGWYGVSVVTTVTAAALLLWAGCRGWARILHAIETADIDRHVEATLTDRHGPRMTPRTLERQVRR